MAVLRPMIGRKRRVSRYWCCASKCQLKSLVCVHVNILGSLGYWREDRDTHDFLLIGNLCSHTLRNQNTPPVVIERASKERRRRGEQAIVGVKGLFGKGGGSGATDRHMRFAV